jgi:hypothetical protein
MSTLLRTGRTVARVWVGCALVASCSSVTVPLLTTWEAEVEPVTLSGSRASVAVVSQAGRAATSIQLVRGEAGVTYSWRLESGVCPDGGVVVGGRAVYPQLTVGSQGSAEGETVLSRELDPRGRYVARVFRRPADGVEELDG